jgi:hypothetical protein
MNGAGQGHAGQAARENMNGAGQERAGQAGKEEV